MISIKKIVGWALLIIGLLIIVYSLYSSYNIFTAKNEAPEVFLLKETQTVRQSSSNDIQAQMDQVIQNQLKDILPISSIYGFLNLTAWSIFVGLLVFGGAQISGIGIKLLI